MIQPILTLPVYRGDFLQRRGEVDFDELARESEFVRHRAGCSRW